MTDRAFALDVVRTLRRAGFTALWAGGCVRDELLGLTPHDFDVATDARPEQVIGLFRRSVAVGAAFGVVEVVGPRGPHHKHVTVEVATFRSDGSYTDGRRPDSVTFSTPEEDAKRRDFTINGMFFDPLAEEIHDFVGGRADLAAKVLRAIGDPAERFAEDKLRMLRAVRIAARFGLAIDPATLAAAKVSAASIRAVSAERIADELRKLLTHPTRGRGVRLLHEFDLVPPLLPERVADWESGARAVGELAGEVVSFPLAFAALLHDLGVKTAVAIGERLKLSTADKTRLTWLVEHVRALADAPTLRPCRLKPLLAHDGAGELIALHRAAGANAEAVDFAERTWRETPREELDPPPLLTGADLIAEGLKPGPAFKRMLDAARDAQLDGTVKTTAEALAAARAALAPG